MIRENKMRCGCVYCGAYMVHRDNNGGCVCPDCGNECRVCLGQLGEPGIKRTRDGKTVVPDELMRRYLKGNDDDERF